MSTTPTENHLTELVTEKADRFKIAQALYNAITGKTETLSRAYAKDYLIGRADLEQLFTKCEQACAQWKVLNRNSNITVHHIDDNKEQFSSFERFKIYDASRTAATESIVFEYHILLELPNTEKPQPYKIQVRAISRIAMMRKMEKEMVPASFIRLFSAGNIVVEVEYVDYVVARNMVSVIDSWVDEIERQSRLEWIKHVQRASQWFAPVAQFVITILAASALIAVTPKLLSTGSQSALEAQWIILSGTSVFLASLVARRLGRWAEFAVDTIESLSAINLNKGDARLIERYKGRNIWQATQAAIAFILLIVQGIGTNWLSDFLKGLIQHP